MRFRLPVEVSATLLAASTVFVGMAGLPAWGIFLGWAATSLCGGPTGRVVAVLWRTLPLGAVFAVATAFLQGWLAGVFGPDVPVWASLLLAILVMNPGMLLLGRIRALSLIPGMFIGFSTVLATQAGHFGPVPGNIMWSAACGLAMNLVGLGVAWAATAMSGGRPATAPAAPASPTALHARPYGPQESTASSR
ncbi:DUF1097 domain-containing protein [Pseudarthrobacter sp. H2]|uniref:DUF1097 domain-containing protein n=1 Tax=Pseudarthrobacter sp. H2 TaxID=3418415 RepID=UPI003CE7E273